MTLHINEWPQEIIPYMSGKVIQMAIMLRESTGCVMIPSPDPEAHVRHDDDGTSQHSTNGGKRRSTGTDTFLRNNQASKFWLLAQQNPDLTGFGIYFDVSLNDKKRVMVHMDQRPGNRLLWVCPDQESREYIYYHKEPSRYLQILGEQFKKIEEWT